MTRRILRYAAPLIGVAAAAAIVSAPTAAAVSTTQDCTYIGSLETECQSPGNTQINDSPPVTFGYQYPYWYGGGGYWGGYGGFGHGGHR